MADTTMKTQVKQSLTYDDKVIKKIAGIATDSVNGVLTLSGGLIGSITDRFRSTDDKTKGVDAEVGERQVALDLNVVCEYGKNIPELFSTVIDKITAAVKVMTGLDVVEVNMHVEDVLNHSEFEEMREKQQSNSGDEYNNDESGRVQ